MSEPKVAELLRSVGVQISDGHISNLLIKDQVAFHAEKDALYRAGLASSPWQHLDDTSTRVNGQNGYCHIVCNPLYTAYFTTEAKDCLTVLDVLTNRRPRRFLVTLLLDSRVVELPMSSNPIVVTLSSLKPFFFNGLQ
jgi:hypothetical protein